MLLHCRLINSCWHADMILTSLFTNVFFPQMQATTRDRFLSQTLVNNHLLIHTFFFTRGAFMARRDFHWTLPSQPWTWMSASLIGRWAWLTTPAWHHLNWRPALALGNIGSIPAVPAFTLSLSLRCLSEYSLQQSATSYHRQTESRLAGWNGAFPIQHCIVVSERREGRL